MKTVSRKTQVAVANGDDAQLCHVVGFGLAARKGQIDIFGDLANLIHTLPEPPRKIVTSLRTFRSGWTPPALNAANPQPDVRSLL